MKHDESLLLLKLPNAAGSSTKNLYKKRTINMQSFFDTNKTIKCTSYLVKILEKDKKKF